MRNHSRDRSRCEACFAVTSAHDARRSRRILKLIAIERTLRGLVLAAAGVYLVGHLTADYEKLAERVMRAFELDPHRPFLHRIVLRLHNLRSHQLLIAGLGAMGYGVLELVEGVGLWLDQLWAEYLTAIATSLLVPLELYALVRAPSVWKALGLAINVAIVAYLVWLLRRRSRRASAQD